MNQLFTLVYHLHTDGAKVETVRDFMCFGSKIIAGGKIKRYLLLDSMLKSRAIPLPTKIYLVKAMVFPLVMYGRESWTIKKAEH